MMFLSSSPKFPLCHPTEKTLYVHTLTAWRLRVFRFSQQSTSFFLVNRQIVILCLVKCYFNSAGNSRSFDLFFCPIHVLGFDLSTELCIAKIIIKLVSLWRLAELEASTRDIIASSSLGVLSKLKPFSNRFPETETWQWLTTAKWSPKWSYCICICSKATNANNISPGPCCGCQSECINDDGRTLPTLFFSSPMVTLCSIGFRSVESNNGWYTSQQAQIYMYPMIWWRLAWWTTGRFTTFDFLLFFFLFLAGPGERDPINKASSISIRHTPILFSFCLPSFRRLPTMFQVLIGSFPPPPFLSNPMTSCTRSSFCHPSP